MIEKMKVVHIVTTVSEKTALLDRLRELGVIHFAEKADADQRYLTRFAALSKAAAVLQEYSHGEQAAALSDDEFETFFRELTDCIDRRKVLQEQQTAAHAAAERLAEWGHFSPAQLRELQSSGWDIHIYRTDKKTMAALERDPDVRFIRLSPVGKMPTLAALAPLPASYSATEFPIPEKGLDELEREQQDCAEGLRECEAFLTRAAQHLPDIRAQLLKTQNDAEYSAVSNTSQGQDGLVWLSGYLPVSEAEGFKKAAAQAHWAWAMDDPAGDDEKVPTKVQYNKVTKLMIPVFDILGHSTRLPGVRHLLLVLGLLHIVFRHDHRRRRVRLSVPAGGIGADTEGQGLVQRRAAAVGAVRRHGDMGRADGTWFGLEQAMDVPLLKSLVIPTFANYPAYFDVSTTTQQNTIMKFCFILGTVQLSLACVMNIRRKLKEKDLSWVSDLAGWPPSTRCISWCCIWSSAAGEPAPRGWRGHRRIPAGGVLWRYVAGQELRAGAEGGFGQRLYGVSQHHQCLWQHHELHPAVRRRHGLPGHRPEFQRHGLQPERAAGHRRRAGAAHRTRAEHRHGPAVRGGTRRPAEPAGIFRAAGHGVGRHRLRSLQKTR